MGIILFMKMNQVENYQLIFRRLLCGGEYKCIYINHLNDKELVIKTFGKSIDDARRKMFIKLAKVSNDDITDECDDTIIHKRSLLEENHLRVKLDEALEDYQNDMRKCRLFNNKMCVCFN